MELARRAVIYGVSFLLTFLDSHPVKELSTNSHHPWNILLEQARRAVIYAVVILLDFLDSLHGCELPKI